ncbi:hypothetical protein ACFVUS_12680 [Nocardia sp. NPDC058058]|uniref:hypothetical protein n=1 Tax=Nocardia sp. NPDC058058 TaxID=3346317 RepID=UPI0036D9DFC3
MPTKHAELDQRKQDATADFRFATEQLGISREQAIAWIAQGYGVTTRAVERWGIADEETAHEHR